MSSIWYLKSKKSVTRSLVHSVSYPLSIWNYLTSPNIVSQIYTKIFWFPIITKISDWQCKHMMNSSVWCFDVKKPLCVLNHIVFPYSLSGALTIKLLMKSRYVRACTSVYSTFSRCTSHPPDDSVVLELEPQCCLSTNLLSLLLCYCSKCLFAKLVRHNTRLRKYSREAIRSRALSWLTD